MRHVIVVLALLAACAGAAHARGKNEAKDAFKRATLYYNLGDFTRALDSFKKAYLQYPDPSFLFNIGQCQRQLGQKNDAMLSYRAYLREAPNAPNRAEVQSLVANLEQLIRQEEATRKGRPQGTMKPGGEPTPSEPTPGEPAAGERAPAVAAPAETRVEAHAAAPERTPVYKKWWLWTVVGVVAVGAGVGLGVGLGASSSTHYPSGSFSDGTIRF